MTDRDQVALFMLPAIGIPNGMSEGDVELRFDRAYKLADQFLQRVAVSDRELARQHEERNRVHLEELRKQQEADQLAHDERHLEEEESRKLSAAMKQTPAANEAKPEPAPGLKQDAHGRNVPT